MDRFLIFRWKPTPGPGTVVVVRRQPDLEGTDWSAVVPALVSLGMIVTTLIMAINR